MKPRDIALALLLAGAVGLAFLWPRLELADGSELMGRIPEGGWQIASRVVPMTELERRWLGQATGLKRLYTMPSGAWLLAVTDGTRDRKNVHDPTYCFRGDGWVISRRDRVACGPGHVEVVTMTRDGKELTVAYWFSDGRRIFASAPEYWIRATARRLTRGLTGPEPLLFLLRPVSTDDPDWDTALEFFALSPLRKQ